MILVGVAGAAALGLLAFRNRWLLVLRATLAGLLAVVLSVGFTAIGYDAAAFQAPSYTGSLRLVPQLFGPVEGAIERVGYFREELRRVVAGAARAYAAIESNPLGRGDEVRVLHISDIHLSTLGYGFAQELSRSFDVDLVIDTGDTTSFGASNEEFILSEIPGFGLPYVWVRGNHDSRAFQEALGRVDGTIVLDGDTTEVDGFTIYGLGHPYFNEARGTPVGDEDVVALVEGAADQVLADVSALAEAPDIVIVHDDRMAERIAGLVPLVISGHFHDGREEVRDGTVYLRVGTTGGAGPDRVHRGGRRAVLGGGPVLPGERGGTDAPGGVGRRDAVPRDREPRDRPAPGVGRRRVAEPLDPDSDRQPDAMSTLVGDATRAIPIEAPYDLAGTLFPLRRGTGDPTMRFERRNGVARRTHARGPGHAAARTGSATACARRHGVPARPGRSSTRPALIGAEDDVSAFEPHDDVMAGCGSSTAPSDSRGRSTSCGP